MPIYSMDVKLYATAYVRAADPAEALEIIKANFGNGQTAELPDGYVGEAEVTGCDFGPNMPDVTLSPAVTFHGPDDGDQPCLADDDGEEEEEETADDGAGLGAVRHGREMQPEDGFILLDAEDGEEDELGDALDLVTPDAMTQLMLADRSEITAALVQREGPGARPSEIWATTWSLSLAGRDEHEFTRIL